MKNPDKIFLKFYVIKKSIGTEEMIRNLKSLLDARVQQEYVLEIIDILSNPEIAVQDKILASPTLVKTLPIPSKRIVGKLTFHNLIEELEIN